jgi:hypothetical protein
MREPDSALNLLGLAADEAKLPIRITGTASGMMDSLSNEHRDPALLAKAGHHRFGVALAELALTVALILSIVVVLAVAGTSGAMAQSRPDLMIMEESTSLTTALIIAIIVVVMSILTIFAIRDASPKGAKRRTTASRR